MPSPQSPPKGRGRFAVGLARNEDHSDVAAEAAPTWCSPAGCTPAPQSPPAGGGDDWIVAAEAAPTAESLPGVFRSSRTVDGGGDDLGGYKPMPRSCLPIPAPCGAEDPLEAYDTLICAPMPLPCTPEGRSRRGNRSDPEASFPRRGPELAEKLRRAPLLRFWALAFPTEWLSLGIC